MNLVHDFSDFFSFSVEHLGGVHSGDCPVIVAIGLVCRFCRAVAVALIISDLLISI